MRRGLYCVLLLLLLLAAGCRQPRPEPRVVADRVFSTDLVRVTVAPYGHDRGIVPRIIGASLLDLAGHPLGAPLVVAPSPEMPEEGQTAAAALPVEPARVQLRLAVVHGEATYGVIVPFCREPADGETRWIRGEARVRYLGKAPEE
ncbi:MAG: hypothetical protein ACOC93_01875 [Planctomycetota bacterium]